MAFSRILNFIKPHWYQAILIAVLLYITIRFIEEHGFAGFIKNIDIRKAMFFLYLSLILCTAFLSRSVLIEDSLAHVFDNFWPIAWEEEENILAFIPITFLYLHAYDSRRPIIASAVLAFAISAFIEISQLISCLGSFQLSDLLYNTIGGIIGGLIFILVCRLIRILLAYVKRKKSS